MEPRKKFCTYNTIELYGDERTVKQALDAFTIERTARPAAARTREVAI